MPAPRRSARLGSQSVPAGAVAALWLAAALVPLALVLAGWDWLTTTKYLGTISLLDLGDINVYFRESAWIVGHGTLYVTIRSEYPLLADLLFAAVRIASRPLVPVFGSLKAYQVTWIALAYWGLLGSVVYSIRSTGRRSALLWLTPAAAYFAVLRFDLAPTMLVFVALVEARSGRPRAAAAWWGVAIALKGYALYALPALLVWVLLRFGWRRAAEAGVLAVAPMAASMGIVYVLAGLDAMLMPFRIQASRPPNGQSTWDVLRMLTGLRTTEWLARHPYAPTLLSLAAALGAAALRPRTFGGLVRACTLGIGGFVTFSVFYSPQYVLWFLPMAALDAGAWMFGGVVLLGWVTFIYFPVLYGQPRTEPVKRAAYQVSVIATTLVRTGVIAAALPGPRRSPRPEQQQATAPGAPPGS